MKNLIMRTIFGALFVVAMVGGIVWHPYTMILLFAIVTGMTLWEFGGLVNNHVPETQINRFISTMAGIYLFLAVAAYCIGITANFTVFVPWILTIIYLFVAELYLKQTNPVNNWAYTMLGQVYIALPFSLINLLAFNQNDTYNWLLPLSIFIFLWVNDTGAYCAGSLFGKHKLFPRISPGKSWEGSIGGSIFVMIAACIIAFCGKPTATGECSWTVGNLYLTEWMGLGFIIVVFGTLGDLVESLFKRTIGIKDSGNVIPGHGGMLDRFDSSLMAIPAAVIYLYTLTLL